ncbi:MAG: TOBE domain-containing protein [Microvirga sp.]
MRPDAIFLEEGAAGDGLAGTIRKASYLGTQVEYDVDTALGELFVVRYGSPDIIPPGTPVSITLAIRRGVAIIPGA